MKENQIINKRMNELNLKPDIVKAYQVDYKDVASVQEKLGKIAGVFFHISLSFLGLWVRCIQH
ncbi:MAG: hypothetical protein CM1200mP1_07850 [Candidatus Neomarinimicrobiota bacterium]|nr:MAG: hypothetical protein CM1200mP1_07850 [Candidatus Neomarinimicrobiota bacterium]